MKTNCSKRKKTISKNSLSGTIILILLSAILLSACGGQDSLNETDYFIPPTLEPKPPTPTPVATLTPTPNPTNEAECYNNLRFISDVTYPDNTVVAPGQKIEKIWLVQNIGTCNWEADYTVRNMGGPPLGSSTIVALYPVRSGGEYELTINFTAPTDEGAHASRWQAHGPEGEPFGQEFYILIIVDPEFSPASEGEDD